MLSNWYFLVILGGVLGWFISWIFYRMETAIGTLNIDETDPNKDLYTLDIGDLDSLSTKKRVVLKVHNTSRK